MLQTEGIVFRTTRFGESSLILDIFTEAEGLQSFVANGVYSKKSQRLSSLLQLMNIVELIAHFHENKDLHRIKEINPGILYQNIPFDIRRSAMGTFMLEVCRNCIRDRQVNPSLYHFIRDRFVALDQQQIVDPDFHLYFLFDLSVQLGFGPMDNFSETDNAFDPVNGVFVPAHSLQAHLVTPEDSLLLHAFFREKQGEVTGRSLPARRKILHHLLQFFKFHVAGFREIKSMSVFREILQ